MEKIETFQDYLQSNMRRESYINNPNFPNQELLEERLAVVNHADVCNFEELVS